MHAGVDPVVGQVSPQRITLLGGNANGVEKRANIVESGGREANQIAGLQPL